MKILLVLFSLIFAIACSTSKCKSIDDNGHVRDSSNPMPPTQEAQTSPLSQPQLAPAVSNTSVTTPAGKVTPQETAPQSPASAVPTTATVKVYKYDNSRQCSQGKSVSLEDMAKELKNIKVVSQAKTNDGMMRIQMCGAPTGVANVYEIDPKDLKRAIKLGFREWKYSQQ